MAASSMSSPPPEFPSGCCLTTSGQTLPGKNDSDTQVYSCKGLVPKSKSDMPPASANTLEEGGKDTSWFKISSPARFYSIYSYHYL